MAIVVVLSHRSLDTPGQVTLIIAGQSEPHINIIPMNIPSFKFPTADYFSDVLPNVIPNCSSDHQNFMSKFFKRISAPLTIHASDDIISTQCGEILRRIFAKTQLSKSAVGLPKSKSVDTPPPTDAAKIADAAKSDAAGTTRSMVTTRSIGF